MFKKRRLPHPFWLSALCALLMISAVGCSQKSKEKPGTEKEAAVTKEGEDAPKESIGEDKGTETEVNKPSAVPSGEAIVGQPLPDVQLKDITGNTVQLRDLFFGKTGVVVFVGEECPPCVTELKKLNDHLAAGKLPVSVVVIGRDQAGADPVLKEAGVSFPLFLDAFGEGGIKLGVRAKGTFFLVDNLGRLQTTGQLEVAKDTSGGGTFLDMISAATKGKYPDPRLWDTDPWKRWAAGDLAKRKPAPAFALAALNGKTYALQSVLKKQNVVLIFFNRRCPHCTKELPIVQKFYEAEAKNLNFEVLALTPSPDATEDNEIRTYARDYSLTFPILPLRDEHEELFTSYGISSNPAWGVIGQDGKFYLSNTGEHPDIGQALGAALKELQ